MAGEAMTLSELQEKIAKRAWEDPAFEAEFMADPKATFEKYTGRPLPEEVKIFAHYNSPSEIHFVLPRRTESIGDELSDEDLERVAGGETAIVLSISIAASVGLAVSVVATQDQDW